MFDRCDRWVRQLANCPQFLFQLLPLLAYQCGPFLLPIIIISVKKLITHRLGLLEAGKGFQLVAEAKECIKVILEP